MDSAAQARRWPTVGMVAVLALAAGATVAALALDAAVGPSQRAAAELEPGWSDAIPGLGLAVPGAILLRQMPRHPVVWVLCLAGLHWCLDGVAVSWLAYATMRTPALPGAGFAFWMSMRFGAWLLMWLPLLLLLYPDGRLPRGRWRVAALTSLAATAILPLVLLLVPSPAAQAAAGQPLPVAFRGLDLDPISVALPIAVSATLLSIGYATVPVSLLVPFAVVVRRYRVAAADARARMRWLVWAALVDALLVLALAILPRGLHMVALFVAVGVTGLAVAAGIARPHLMDIDRLLGATLWYAVLAAAVIVLDLAVLASTGTLLGQRSAERNAALLALLAVMVVYGPARHRLWRLGRRLIRGRRDDPYRMVAGLAEQLERSDSSHEQLLAVARSLADGFGYPYAAVEVAHIDGSQSLLVEHGRRPPSTQTLPITYRSEVVGRLVLPRHGPRAFSTGRDQRLLADLARQAATAARASHLAHQLQHSREQLVTAREEERRRLRRDLHDGLGPSLGAIALRIDTARNLLPTSPEQADAMLRQTREEAAAALADVRRLVNDLRPPTLDDLGLLGALRQLADRLRPPGLAIHIDTGGTRLDTLPAAVEVAAYRIASEALTNVVRHATAASCRIHLEAGPTQLTVEITDDGGGIPPGTPTGVGLVSLRERAAELGGQCQILCPDNRGTVVRARLPLPAARPDTRTDEVIHA